MEREGEPSSRPARGGHHMGRNGSPMGDGLGGSSLWILVTDGKGGGEDKEQAEMGPLGLSPPILALASLTHLPLPHKGEGSTPGETETHLCGVCTSLQESLGVGESKTNKQTKQGQ